MERPTCKTCPYHNEETRGMDEGDEPGGWCHRHAPSPPVLDITEVGCDGCNEPMVYLWPFTLNRDWCGEHPRFKEWIKSLEADTPA